MSRPIRAICGCVLLFPLSLIFYALGWLLVLSGQAKYMGARFPFLEFATVPGSWFHNLFFEGKWAGSCLCGIILYHYKYQTSKPTLDHERRHAMQWMALGWTFPIFYFGHSILLWLFFPDRHSYFENWFEIDARKEAGQLHEDFLKDPKVAIGDRWIWW